MFSCRGCEPGVVVGGQPADPDKVDAQAPHGLRQVGVGDGSIDGCIQAADELVIVVPGGIRGVEQGRRVQQLALELEEDVGISALGCQRGSFSLEGFAELEQFVDVVQ
jgi:hypothetical protein